jgi:ABC-type multidrug transport system fused ATPase/permease subunit
VLSLLRLTHITEGQVLFDGVDINAIPRQRLRQSLTIIPQDAVLFNGTIGSNLDPTGKLDEADLERTFASCRNMASFQSHRDDDDDDNNNNNNNKDDDDDDVEDEHGDGNGDAAHFDQGISLSTPVNARGTNFSHGQRQVLSLCRALVRRSKLMLLDEATASMDYATDQAIQDVLRQEVVKGSVAAAEQEDGQAAGGSSKTVVTVAHRLRTIVDYDKVLVLGSGQVLE